MTDLRAPHGPLPTQPARRPGSIRRTSSIDLHWHVDGPGTLHLVGRARDLVTDAAGVAAVVGRAGLDVRTDTAMVSTAVTLDPPDAGEARFLEGISVREGFRARAREVFHHHVGEPLGLLLDDIPVAALIAGYASVKQSERDGTLAPLDPTMASMRADLCAGWIATGTMIQASEDGRAIPYGEGPPVPPPCAEDPDGWHDEPSLPVGSMRRRRRIDVLPGTDTGAPLVVDAFFRDTWVNPDGVEEGLHEYSVLVTADPGSGAIIAIGATPRVLPFGECPAAAASVGDVVGLPLGELRRRVPLLLHGIRSCTHLNDQLRCLADVPALLQRL